MLENLLGSLCYTMYESYFNIHLRLRCEDKINKIHQSKYKPSTLWCWFQWFFENSIPLARKQKKNKKDYIKLKSVCTVI